MKRFLKQNRHQLSDLEKENLWHAIGRETRSVATARRPRRSFRPALGLASGLAVLAVAAAWWIGTTDPQRGFIGRDPGVVVLPPEMRVDQAEDRDPALDQRSTMEREVQAQVQEMTMAAAPIETEPAAPKVSPTPSQPAVEKSRAAKVVVSGTGSIRGRVLNHESGEALPHATVLIRGTTRSVFTDSTGSFVFTGLQPGRQVELKVLLLSYAPATITVSMPEAGPTEAAIRLQPVIAKTLEEFADHGLVLMVEGQSAITKYGTDRKTTEKYAVDSVQDALSKQAGVINRAGELYVRGGRSKDGVIDLSARIAGAPLPAIAPPPLPGGSVTGGTKPPNGEQIELMYFEHTGVNPFVATEDDSLSTFAVDVDNASWTLARSYLRRGMLPPKEAIRVEEFVNAFDAGWGRTTDEAFKIHNDGSLSRFGQGYHLLRIGVVGKTVDDEHRKAANLVFIIDISGSMNRENRLGLVKKSLHILLDELREGDRVGIVVYGSRGRVLLEPTDIERRETIERAIDSLGPGGSTNAFEGLELAYAMARRTYEAGKVNRLILCSDGVANNGASTKAEVMLEKIRRSSDEGITLSTIGFGMGNYNDVLMEKLANQGDGNYYYVDEKKEAERVFRENLTGLLQTIAREVKIQVEFDKQNVTRWRLLGYENRDVADRDFRNDAVDAGEVGSGHQVTALYEIKLAEQPTTVANRGILDIKDYDDDWSGRRTPVRLGTVRLRHEAPAHDTALAGQVQEMEIPLLLDSLSGDFAGGSVWLRTQAVVAEFAEILRGSYWAKESRLADLIPIADGLAAEMPGDAQVKELAELIRLAADIEEKSGDQGGNDLIGPLEKEELRR